MANGAHVVAPSAPPGYVPLELELDAEGLPTERIVYPEPDEIDLADDSPTGGAWDGPTNVTPAGATLEASFAAAGSARRGSIGPKKTAPDVGQHRGPAQGGASDCERRVQEENTTSISVLAHVLYHMM